MPGIRVNQITCFYIENTQEYSHKHGRFILFAELVVDMRAFIANTLTEYKHNVEVANNGEDIDESVWNNTNV